MPEFLRKLIEQMKALLKELTATQKVTVLLFAAVTIIGFTFLFMWAKHPTMQFLYGNLNYQDAASIRAKLDEQKVPYKFSEDGTSVYVPADKVGEMRMALAGEGIIRGGAGKGFELFDKTQIGITDFAQKLNYQRALQAELARTIMELDSVESARVHLVLQEDSVFLEDKKPAKASVIVKLRNGSAFSKNQAIATTNLVAGSVEGLEPNNVTVVDVAGNILSKATEKDDFYSLSTSQIELQRNIEKELESKILTMVEPLVGPNNARTKVTVSLASDRVEQTEEIYDPDAPAIRNEETVDEKSENGAEGGGVPGTESNLEGTQVQTGGEKSTKSKSVSKTNYELSKTLKHTIKTPGAIEKLSVALVVNDAVRVVKTGDKTEFKTEPRNDQEMEQFRQVVMSAVGFNADRGDEVTVSNISFDTSVEEKNKVMMAKMEKEQFWISLAKYPAMVVLFLLIFFFIIRPLLRVLSREAPIMLPSAELEALPSGLHLHPGLPRPRARISAEAPKTLEEIEAELAQELSEGSLTVEAQKRGILLKRVNELAQQTPDKVAEVVRLWLTEK
ncbi:flagellar M-ring protein FliF [bacterium]|nr:flagellar M-ring protein FliF [bacterium]